jgi:SpoVK/Ycf46/Vps4 family AAA+-type ATPase
MLKNSEICALYLLRIFDNDKNFRYLVKQNHIRDDDVARAIGLGKWVDRDSFRPSTLRKEVREMRQKLEFQLSESGYNEQIECNLNTIHKLISLKKDERAVVLFLILLARYDAISDAWNILDNLPDWDIYRFIGQCIGVHRIIVRSVLAPSGRLHKIGLLGNSRHYRRATLPSLFSETLAGTLLEERITDKTFYDEILKEAPAPTLSPKDFYYLHKDLPNLRTYLQRSIQKKRKGVNVLLYGPPGTGKTQLSRILARSMRCTAYEMQSEDGDGDALDPEKKFAQFRLANKLLGGRSVIVVDEAEDLFNGAGTFGKSAIRGQKSLLHEVLESNKLPVIWITNYLDGLCPANIRRFDYVMHVDNPPPKQRARVIRAICGKTVSKSVVERLSKFDSLSPAVVARACRFTQTVCNHKSTTDQRDAVLTRSIKNTLEAQRFETIPEKDKNTSVLPKVYNPKYISTTTNLQELSQQLVTHRSGRICLYGPPGTGKSSFIHHIARVLKSEVHLHRVSDLQSPYVGVCEKNLAEAFRAAADKKAILALDEVDTFLNNRNDAHRQWEVSQVNEFLTQLEAFKGLFFATTNLVDRLDPAAMRRFDMKILFDFLKPEQSIQLLNAHCRELKLSRLKATDLNRLSECAYLTPGDFGNIRHQNRLSPIASSEEFIDRLLNEVRFKPVPQASSRSIGFGAA